MPSFYPRSLPRQLPLTPPEFVPSYNTAGCGGMQYQQQYGGHATVGHHDEGAYFAERYDHPVLSSGPTPSSVMFPQAGAYAPNSAILPPPQSYYDLPGAPLLPPMRVQERASMSDMEMHRRNQEQQARAQKAREEKPTGGVSSELDYEMDIMTDFVSEMGQRLIQPDHPLQIPTRKWVHSVLSATRLPSSTIILGLHYMNRRMKQLQQAGQARGVDVQLTRMITLGLLLGSKFLDDNTFINRSWAEVSGINVQDLNRMEKEWLAAFEFKLHVDPSEPQGFDYWRGHWKDFETQAVARASRHTKLAPINTNVHSQQSFNYALSKSHAAAPFSQDSAAPHYHQGFGKLPTPEYHHQKPQLPHFNNASSFSHYDHTWGMPRSATETSPASTATLTGPATPEYYGAHNVWGPPEGYSRRTMFGFPPVSQAPAQHHLGFGGSCYSAQYHPGVWNSHGMHCNCFQCVRQHPPYMMGAGFGPQAVVS